MSGRRLAKRSIIGTKVCAPGPDGLWYSGVIQDVKTPPCSTVTSTTMEHSDLANSDTKYIVRFDFKTQATVDSTTSTIMDARRVANLHISPVQTLRRNAMTKEFRETDLIGPGFRSITGIQLQPGQRIYITHSGRETSGDVIHHDPENDEVTVKITAIGIEEPIELKKRLEEVRLLESRRSARLADQDRDTDFARLADMGGDRRRTSHSIEVPYMVTPSNNSRKRPTSYTHECFSDECNEMNECNAALILMKLHNSPKSPTNGDKWLASSPGSSSASWSSGSSSPPLSDDGHVIHSSVMPTDATARIRTTSVSTSDEGIVVDFTEEVPRKKKASRFLCTWKGCVFVETTIENITSHIRNVHLRKKSARRNDKEEEFYFTEEEDEDDDEEDDDVEKTTSPTSPPTLSHRDMARPPHEDPEYQRQIVGNFKQGRQYQQQHNANTKTVHITNTQILSSPHQIQVQNNSTICTPASPLAHHNYTWTSNSMPITSTPISHQQQVTYIKHARSSPRPSQSTAPYPSPTYVHQHHHNYSSSPNSNSSSSNQSSPILHGSNSANNVLQQLSQQNVTITTHHNTTVNNQHQVQQTQLQPQQQQLSAVTITPNFNSTHHHQTLRSYQASSGATASNLTIASQIAQTNLPPQTHHTVVQHVAAATKPSPSSPNRRTRGENKKCRKVYGMDRRDSWCTQCKWKKACTRFGD